MLVIETDFRGLTNAEIYFEYASMYVDSLEEPLEAMGHVVRQQVVENFVEQGALVGGWVPLSAKYLASKEKRLSAFPDTILMLTGGLFEDAGMAKIDVDDESMSVWIENPLAEIHHEGQGRVPSRPIWEYNEMFSARCNEIAYEWLRDLKRHAPPEPGGGNFSVSESGKKYYSNRDAKGRFKPRYYN